MWVGPLIFSSTRDVCLNNPIFSNLVLCAACWACFMCHHELWPPSVSHPFSLDSSLGLTGGKYYQKITIPIFRLILQNFAFPAILFCCNVFSLLSSGWLVAAELVRLSGLLFVFVFYLFFLQFIVACRLCVICVKPIWAIGLAEVSKFQHHVRICSYIPLFSVGCNLL